MVTHYALAVLSFLVFKGAGAQEVMDWGHGAEQQDHELATYGDNGVKERKAIRDSLETGKPKIPKVQIDLMSKTKEAKSIADAFKSLKLPADAEIDKIILGGPGKGFSAFELSCNDESGEAELCRLKFQIRDSILKDKKPTQSLIERGLAWKKAWKDLKAKVEKLPVPVEFSIAANETTPERAVIARLKEIVDELSKVRPAEKLSKYKRIRLFDHSQAANSPALEPGFLVTEDRLNLWVGSDKLDVSKLFAD